MAKRRRRRGFRGLGALGRGGMEGVLPVATGGILTAGTTIGLRAFLRPDPGTLSEKLYYWAPALGVAAGVLGAGALYFMGGMRAALPAVLTSIAAGGLVFGAERLNASKPGGMLAIAGGSSVPAEPGGTAGLNALMPEYSGLNAIVMDPVNGISGPSGETVSINGLGGAGYRPSAFGKPPY